MGRTTQRWGSQVKKFIAGALTAGMLFVPAATVTAAAATPGASAPTPTLSKVFVPTSERSRANALREAKSYLKMTAFSKAGLIDQLSSKYGSGYSKADAVWAVNHLNVSWNKQAVRAAKSYLKMSPFSRNALIRQLSSKYGSQFTRSQALYAVNRMDL